jgi:hypothetical protein
MFNSFLKASYFVHNGHADLNFARRKPAWMLACTIVVNRRKNESTTISTCDFDQARAADDRRVITSNFCLCTAIAHVLIKSIRQRRVAYLL